MKKTLLAFAFILLSYGAVHARESEKFQRWRSTESCSADTNVLVATGVVYIKDVLVSSGTGANTSQFQYFNSTTTTLSISRSTSTTYDTDTTGDYFLLNEVLKSGFLYTKTGTSCVRVRWDWYVKPNNHQESLGLKD